MTASLHMLASHIFSAADFEESEAPARHVATSPSHSRVADPLVVAIKESNADAFRELMQTHYNGLLRFLTSLIASEDVADDLVQELFVRVWNGRARLDPTRSIRTYLFTSARHAALDRQKHERAQQRLLDGVRQDDDVPTTDDTGVSDERAAQLVTLAQALTALPERRRTALSLRFDQGMTHAEIGAVLGVSDKAAQQLVLRTIAELRHLLGVTRM